MLKPIFNAVAVNGKAILFAAGIATIAVSSAFLCGGCSNLDELLKNNQEDSTAISGDSTITPPDTTGSPGDSTITLPDTTGNPGDSTVTPPDPCVANPNGPGCQTAPTTYTLTVGRNDASAGGVSRDPGKSTYDAGETVTVTATPKTGYVFTGWSGAVSGTTNPVTIIMDGDKTLTANFVWQDATPPPPPVTRYELIVDVSPAGNGFVSLDPDNEDYEKGAAVTATATAYAGYRFTGWSGDATGTTNSVTITMTGNKTLTANFIRVYTVTFDANGATSGTAPTPTMADSGTAITLPDNNGLSRSGHSFGGWNTNTAGTGSNYSANATYTPNSNIPLYARWTAVSTPTDPCDVGPTEACCAATPTYEGCATTDTCSANPKPGCPNYTILTVANLESSMVLVEGGNLTLGCNWTSSNGCNYDANPASLVTVGSFYICKYEVTQGLYKEIMNSNPSQFTGNDDLPVSDVSWNDAQSFISALNAKTGKQYRLPTENEWEFAARGGMFSEGYKYSGSNIINDVGWYRGNSGGGYHTVGGKKPNELGIYDMTGNVWEWVDGKGILFRGCSWDNVLSNGYQEDECLVSIRWPCNPCAFGIRLVMSALP